MRVLSIVGPGRSGSTLLAQVLGEIPGAIDVGELRWLWQRGLRERRLCGCGCPPDLCPQWAAVLARTGPAATEDGVGALVDTQRRLATWHRKIRVLRSPANGGSRVPDLREIRTITSVLLQAIQEVTGAELVVDASKRPIDAAVYVGMEYIDHYVLHLVRDPRAVAFSWGRSKLIPGSNGQMDTMARRSPVRSAARWMENNLGCELLRRQVPPERWLFLRYEDFVREPATELGRVVAWLGTLGTPIIEGDRTVRLSPNHTVAGNPIRFAAGMTCIRADDEWVSAMADPARSLVSALTLPLLLRYGYPLRA